MNIHTYSHIYIYNIHTYSYIFTLRHIGLLEADEDKIQKMRPKGTLCTFLYVPRETIRP